MYLLEIVAYKWNYTIELFGTETCRLFEGVGYNSSTVLYVSWEKVFSLFRVCLYWECTFCLHSTVASSLLLIFIPFHLILSLCKAVFFQQLCDPLRPLLIVMHIIFVLLSAAQLCSLLKVLTESVERTLRRPMRSIPTVLFPWRRKNRNISGFLGLWFGQKLVMWSRSCLRTM